MAVIEALMSLFIKELVTADRVVSTIKRFENLKSISDSTKDIDNDIPKPSDQGEALLLWVTRSGDVLKQRIISELGESGEIAQVRTGQNNPTNLIYQYYACNYRINSILAEQVIIIYVLDINYKNRV